MSLQCGSSALLFFPITFTLRQMQVSGTLKFPVHSSLFSLKWFLLALVIPFFCALTLGFHGESLLCLSVLSHPLTCCRKHLSLLCSATFSMNSCSQTCSSLTLHGIVSGFAFLPFSYPVQLHLIPTSSVWCGGNDFSSCAFIILVHPVVLFSLFPLN